MNFLLLRNGSYMAVLVNSALMEDKQILYVKGAPEIVYGLCKQTDCNVPKEEIERQLEGYQEQAMRTFGLCLSGCRW